MKRFGIIGVGGYVAPRHLSAIKDNGGKLLVALDKNDSVGILDSYFPDAQFFTEFERFDRHVEKLRREKTALDYISIVSPNYLHDSHCRFALRAGASAICEKPLVINPWNIEALRAIETENNQRVYTILQLRLHPAVIALRERVKERIARDPAHVFKVNLQYMTSRGAWYHSSWKGDEAKSGGIVTNIGIHFFDMLIWVFGDVETSSVDQINMDRAVGRIKFANAEVDWFLSIDFQDIPESVRAKGARTYRNIKIDEDELEFSGNFTDLHTLSYQKILAGEGFGLDEAQPSIALVHAIRSEASDRS